MAWFARSGSLGVDRSVNGAAVPLAGYSLALTIPVNQKRNFIEVQNQSTDLIQMVRDNPAPVGDGTQVTSIMLTGAPVAGGQGGNWTSDTFKGRVRVYVPTANLGTDRIGAYED